MWPAVWFGDLQHRKIIYDCLYWDEMSLNNSNMSRWLSGLPSMAIHTSGLAATARKQRNCSNLEKLLYSSKCLPVQDCVFKLRMVEYLHDHTVNNIVTLTVLLTRICSGWHKHFRSLQHKPLSNNSYFSADPPLWWVHGAFTILDKWPVFYMCVLCCILANDKNSERSASSTEGSQGYYTLWEPTAIARANGSLRRKHRPRKWWDTWPSL